MHRQINTRLKKSAKGRATRGINSRLPRGRREFEAVDPPIKTRYFRKILALKERYDTLLFHSNIPELSSQDRL